jgi:hypothetical protein
MAGMEEYIAFRISQDSGGATFSVEDLQTAVENSPVLLIFDGLDEVGSDDLRDSVLHKIVECINRFEKALRVDLKVIVTTRPPAVAGRRDRLPGFSSFAIAPLSDARIDEYLQRWLGVHCPDPDEASRISESFQKRRREPHVQALARNPMQLSVLLHFIRLKGEAFPDRRAELYRDYFKTVIDRDVEKSIKLRKNRTLVEQLHELLGFQIHALTEENKADGTLSREQMLRIIHDWLADQKNTEAIAQDLFALGEERLGLIVALKGEGRDARYGYEIQPVREYFAAAFINEQIQGNAHDVYESLLQRSYWREVALFLAGLRRSNEKADLISRARKVDSNPVNGWRLVGRTITLHLLQEGVFTHPRHVYSDALDFTLDVLDRALIGANYLPPTYIETLAGLIKESGPSHQERVRSLLKANLATTDTHLLFGLLRIALGALPLAEWWEYCMRVQSPRPWLPACAKILWPALWQVDLHKAALSPNFWSPEAETSKAWWRASLIRPELTQLHAPARVHQLIAEQFAYSSCLPKRPADVHSHRWKPTSPWAVWQLVHELRALQQDVTILSKPENEVSEIIKPSFDGLAGPCREAIRDLLKALRSLRRAIADQKLSPDLFSDLFHMISVHIRQPGLPGWIACRCGSDIFLMLANSHRIRSRGHRRQPFVISAFEARGSNTVLSEINALYGQRRKLPKYGFFSDSIYRTLTSSESPWYVRVANGRRLVNRVSAAMLTPKELDLTWLMRAPIQIQTAPKAVLSNRKDISDILPLLGQVDLSNDRTSSILLAKDLQRVSKIARHSESPEILQGALVAMMHSRFENIAGTELVLKMLENDSRTRDLGHRIFSTRDDEGNVVRGWEDVARAIIRHPRRFTSTLCHTASAYLVEREAVTLPPLLSQAEDLGLFVRSAALARDLEGSAPTA